MMLSKAQSKEIRVLGIAIDEYFVEGAIYSSALNGIEASFRTEIPLGTFSPGADSIEKPDQLKQAIEKVTATLRYKGNVVLAVPASTLKLTDVASSMQRSQVYSSLTADLLRYKSYDGSMPAVAFGPVEGSQASIVCAVRQDSILAYKDICAKLKLKVVGMDVMPITQVRGMAVTGVLDALIQQLGTTMFWGSMYVSSDRVRLSVFQGSILMDFREVFIRSRYPDGKPLEINDILEDFVDEVERTMRGRDIKIWFTEGASTDLNQKLKEHFSIVFKPCPLSPDFPCDSNTVSLATVGTAMKCVTGYPFDLNLLSSFAEQIKLLGLKVKGVGGGTGGGLSLSGGGSGGGSSSLLSFFQDIDEEKKLQFIYPGAVAIGLVLITWIGASVFKGMMDNQYAELTINKDNNENQIEQLNQDVLKETRYNKADQFVRDVGTKIILRNQLLLSLVNDLKTFTPDKVWLDTVKIQDSLEMTGLALNHEAMLTFAGNFDKSNYAHQMMLNVVKETVVGATPLYGFEMDGNIDEMGLQAIVDQRKKEAEAKAKQSPTGTTPNTQEQAMTPEKPIQKKQSLATHTPKTLHKQTPMAALAVKL
ncbi:MAG: PilN domain-containing protein [Vampirovibrionales bacterium]